MYICIYKYSMSVHIHECTQTYRQVYARVYTIAHVYKSFLVLFKYSNKCIYIVFFLRFPCFLARFVSQLLTFIFSLPSLFFLFFFFLSFATNMKETVFYISKFAVWFCFPFFPAFESAKYPSIYIICTCMYICMYVYSINKS